MKKKIWIWITLGGISAVATSAVFYFSETSYYQRQGQKLIGSTLPVGSYDLEGNVFKNKDLGSWRVLRREPTVIVSVDTGGGHRGARGYVISELAIDESSFKGFFSESIVFKRVNEKTWTYRSTEE